MSETPSKMIALKSKMPLFTLPDANGSEYTNSSSENGTLIVFMCNHCPFVIHVANVLGEIGQFCKANNINIYGINSNDIEAHPGDSPPNMLLTAKQYHWNFPYLYDESQKVAIKFEATCTPDIFLYDAENTLFYRGQFDESRPSSGISTGRDIKNALKALLQGHSPPAHQKPSIGCNIKWKQESGEI